MAALDGLPPDLQLLRGCVPADSFSDAFHSLNPIGTDRELFESVQIHPGIVLPHLNLGDRVDLPKEWSGSV